MSAMTKSDDFETQLSDNPFPSRRITIELCGGVPSAAPYLYAKHAKKKGPRYTDQAYIPCHSFA